MLMGVAIPPLMTMWADTAWRSGKAESSADAGFYAQELMEEIKTKAYDEKNWMIQGRPGAHLWEPTVKVIPILTM